MVSNNSEVLNCFWLPPQYQNNCVSGASAKTISPKPKTHLYSEHSQKYFQEVTLPKIRKSIQPYPTQKKKLECSKEYKDGFRDIVNDALKIIRSGMRGYVYTIDQLKEVLKFMPDLSVVLDEGIYFLFREK